MKTILKHTIVTLVVAMGYFGFSSTPKEKSIEIIIEELINEIQLAKKEYEILYYNVYAEMNATSHAISKAVSEKDKLDLLVSKHQLEAALELIKLDEAAEISKIRYLKGLQIIKILYEKTLSLDHHFASVVTFNEINNLSNPNQYPEFIKLKENLSSSANKKTGFSLSSILGDNIYTSVVHSFVSLFNNEDKSKKEKEENLEEVECILDFTLRMHNDLNTIYFETAFLQKSNENIMAELQQLFVDFTKPIKYNTALSDCRNTDDWDRVRESLNSYLEQMDKATRDEDLRYKAHKMRINLEFPIDRLLQFITQYNTFIDQGSKFYEKFGIMLNSYENEKQCATKIPLEYGKLKESVNIAIEKFNTAYKPVEINGSKMKEILYGINEYN
jgi:hypothetical protein